MKGDKAPGAELGKGEDRKFLQSLQVWQGSGAKRISGWSWGQSDRLKRVVQPLASLRKP